MEGSDRAEQDRYRTIFESTIDGLVVIELDGTVFDANRAFCEMFGCSREELVGRHVSSLSHSDEHTAVAARIQGLNAGDTAAPIRRARAIRKDGSEFNSESRSRIFEDAGRQRILTVVRDVTERLEAEQQLREKEEQYRSIFEASVDAILIADLDGYVVEASPAACQMWGYSRDEMIGMDASVLLAPESLEVMQEAMETIKSGGNYHRAAVAIRKDGTPFHVEGPSVPFTFREKPHIMSVVRDITERVKTQEELERRVEERTRELSTLLDVSRNVASTLELPLLLDLILEQLKAVVPYTDASILEVDGEELQTIGNRGPLPPDVLFTTRFPFGPRSPSWPVIREGKKVIIEDVWSDGSTEAQGLREAAGELLKAMNVSSWLAVPLVVGERIIGTLTVAHREPHYYTLQHADLAGAIAQQAAIAIENARLFERVQETAILEERQRLSRELHDSVSQALYSIALGAKTARALLDRNPAAVADPLDFVLAQAERGLAEMRALIFELRPEALEQEGLTSALRKQVAALQARHQLQIETVLCEEPNAPAPVKEALYRIAQEALQNIIKHARATQVRLVLICSDDELALEIRDNGTGFDPGDTFPGHLGLSSMRERAARAGGVLELESVMGTGTKLKAHLPRQGSGAPSTAASTTVLHAQIRPIGH